jgi:peptide/nickel transport system ATP-binding protein
MGNLIDVRELSLEFDVRGLRVPVLDRISFRIRPGTTVALVGESGSGKSVTAQALMGILPRNGHITHGQMLLAHEDPDSAQIDLARLDPDGHGYLALRGRRMSMIFQEPMLSLSPVHTVGDQVSEGLFLHHNVDTTEGMRQTEDMLRLVGFPDPARALKMYPFELIVASVWGVPAAPIRSSSTH